LKRNFFLLALVTLILLSFCSVDAQQSKSFRIGWIAAGSAGSSTALDAFRAGMRGLGYVEGRNWTIDARWGEGSTERLERLLAELVRSMPSKPNHAWQESLTRVIDTIAGLIEGTPDEARAFVGMGMYLNIARALELPEEYTGEE